MPQPLNTLTRIAFPMGASLAGNTSFAPISMIVTINTGINASVTIDEIGDAFAKGTNNQNITDQSEDTTSGNGDFNANFDETYAPAPGHGVIWRTTLIQTGSVLLGPSGAPAAVGPTDNNDDYTNKSTNPGNIIPGGSTTAAVPLIFTNTLQNSGNADDTYTLDAPTVPAGFLVEISTNGGTSYTDRLQRWFDFLAVGFRHFGKHPRARHSAYRQTRLNRVQHHRSRHFRRLRRPATTKRSIVPTPDSSSSRRLSPWLMAPALAQRRILCREQ